MAMAPRTLATTILAVALLAASAEAQGALAPLEEHRLDNGLRVILQPLPQRRHVTVCMTYHAGSRDAPRGYTGLAHLTEHAMFDLSDQLGEGGVIAALERYGAVDRNGATTNDRTYYYETLPRENLSWALWLEAHRMGYLLSELTPASLERQRRIVLHESRERGRQTSVGRIWPMLEDEIFRADHPYHDLHEREEDVSAVRLEHVQWFFQTHYAPDNATLVVIGGFEPAEARALVERYFGAIRRSAPAPERPRPSVERLRSEIRITYEAHTSADEVILAWPTPPFGAPGDAELDVLARLLTGRPDRPLNRALARITSSLSVRQHSQELGSMFTISAVAARGHHTGEVVEAIDRVLAEAREREPDASEVQRARAVWAEWFRLLVEEPAAFARHLGIRTPDGRVPGPEYEQARYRAVEPSDVRDVVRRWLPQHGRVVTFVASNPSAPRGGRLVSRQGGGR